MAAGAAYRDALDTVLATPDSRRALDVDYEAVIRPHDFIELFETEPDLAGGFTDVSRYVRDQDRNVDTHVFWRETRWPRDGEPAPAAEELCPVAFYSLQQFLKGIKGKAREWNPEAANGEGKWEDRRWYEVRPGMSLRLWMQQGGYSNEIGWTGNPAHKPAPTSVSARQPEGLSGDHDSEGPSWVSLPGHTDDVAAEVESLVRELGLSSRPEEGALLAAARWHDVGKASPRWEAAIRRYLAALREKIDGCPLRDDTVERLLNGFAAVLEMPEGGPWAKFPDVRYMKGREQLTPERWADLRRALYTPFRPGFRHEAASALVAWQAWQQWVGAGLSGLAVYLIATHHGKVRTVLRSTRDGDAVFGIVEGESLPPCGDLIRASTPIPTGPRRFGAEGDWVEYDGTVTFTPRWPRCTSWSSLVADLLGGLPGQQAGREGPLSVEEGVALHRWEDDGGSVAKEKGPLALGPFQLAYLEMIFRVADAWASACPGRGKKQ
jgi:CRISPR-associated endonuclease/helicase Cas3